MKVVHRDMAFLGQESIWAAEAANCAAEQGRFWEYADRLYANQGGRNGGSYSKENLKRYGSEVGLDSGSFNACVDGGRYAAAVRAENEEGPRKGVTSTTRIFVNGTKQAGVPTWEQLLRLIEDAR